MSKKFTGITSAGSAIPVYDKDAHSALQNKADVSALTAYQEKGDYYSASNPSGFLTAVPAGYATTGDIEDLSTAIAETFQPQSAMTAYLTAVPEGYATEQWVGEQGYLTAVPEGYATTGDIESAISGKQDISGMTAYQEKSSMSAYAVSGDLKSVANTILIGSGQAWSSQWSSGYPCVDFEATKSALRHQYIPDGPGLVAHSGAWQLDGSTPSEVYTFDVLGGSEFAFQTNLGPDYSARLKVDNQTFIVTGVYPVFNPISSFTTPGTTADTKTVSAQLLTRYQTYGTWNFNYSATEIVPAHYDNTVVELAEKNDLSAYQPVGEYYSASNPSGFITGVDLTPYQTIEGMSAYQPSGDYLTAVPDTYLQNTDLSTTDGKITAISGIPLSAGGGEVPEGVMSESGLEYNAVNEISGYNGSAIAQYGAEKQWLTHDDTIVHVSNSAQYAFGVNLSGISADLAKMMGVDETLLFNNSAGTSVSDGIPFSENPFNFNELKIYWFCEGNTNRKIDFISPAYLGTNNKFNLSYVMPADAFENMSYMYLRNCTMTLNTSGISMNNAQQAVLYNKTVNIGPEASVFARAIVCKVVGINRISGGN